MRSLRLLLVAATSALAIPLAACAPHPVHTDPCKWMEAAGNADADRTVILVDVSNSTRSPSGSSGAPDFVTALDMFVRAAVDGKQVVSIGSFSGPGVDPIWIASEETADYSMTNPDNQNGRYKAALNCLGSALHRAAFVAPAAPGTDVLYAIRAAAPKLGEGKGKKTIVVATDGLSTTGCADLTKAGFAETSEIENITRVCSERGETTAHGLAGTRLVMRGIGHPAPGHPSASAAQLHWLEQLWSRLCLASVGDKPGLCDISAGSAAGNANTKGPPMVENVLDPPVSFPGNVITYHFDGDLLFDTASDQLLPDAEATLEYVAVDIRTRHYRNVMVNGYADSRGSERENWELGQRRAVRVADTLRDKGLVNVTPQSYGETAPKCPDEFSPSGVPNPAALQCNRRVEIVVTLVGSA